jgi:sortase (surface protein transpeptidase)
VKVRRRSFAAVAPALALALLLCACAGPRDAEAGAPGDGAAAAAPAAEVSAARENPLYAGRLQDPRRGEPAAVPAGTPTGIRIPSIGVESALESLGLDEAGQLRAPNDYDVAGWYSDGVVPGAIGPAIIAGHVDSASAPAVFARLAELGQGDEVIVTMSDGSERAFRVTTSMQSQKSDFPSGAVYSNVPVPELRLITCSGGFDPAIGHYSDNLIVFATLVR